MEKTLNQRASRSGRWVVLGHLLSQVLRLVGNLVLTRLLIPEMFGVMAIVTVIISGLGMFSDVGLLQNIVQSKRGEESDYLNTAWTIQVIRGLVIFFIALFVSCALYFLGIMGYISPERVYGHSDLPILLASVSVTAVIAGFNSIHILLLNRRLMLGKLVTIELISQITGLVAMLGFAWYTRNIWALVLGTFVSVSMKMILSHIVNIGGRCHFFWDKEAVHEIFHFGKWIFLSSILGFLLNEGDRILLGGLISTEMLGVYTVAFFLATAVKKLALKLISSVFFPMLSETIRNNTANFEKTYYEIRKKIDLIAMFSAGFFYSIGREVVKLLYDTRYSEAGWMFETISLSLASIGFMLSSQCFLAHGNSKLLTYMIAIQVIAFYPLVLASHLYFGLTGVVWAICFLPFIMAFLSLFLMNKFYFLDLKKEFRYIPIIFIGFILGEYLKGLYYGYNPFVSFYSFILEHKYTPFIMHQIEKIWGVGKVMIQ